MTITNDELLLIQGGASLSGSLISSLVKGIEVLYNLGKSLGSSIKSLLDKGKC